MSELSSIIMHISILLLSLEVGLTLHDSRFVSVCF